MRASGMCWGGQRQGGEEETGVGIFFCVDLEGGDRPVGVGGE